jgi:amidohydrolase
MSILVGGQAIMVKTDEHILKIWDCIDKRMDEIIGIGEDIYRNPEVGFKEFRTSRLVADKLRSLGLRPLEFDDIPGVKATIDTGRDGPAVAIIGELDAVVCRDHADCDRETGAVHACGHNIQIAAMLGTAMGILDSGIINDLVGRIHFIAVPAEEYIEIAQRAALREKGVIKYLGGKPELLSRGWFDDVDMCMMVHASTGDKMFYLESGNNGFIVKNIKFVGRASHAGAAPHEGINALYAANIGLAAINSLRETFTEKDYIRIHPIITKGGEIVNIIPDIVQMETYVRGSTMNSILEANRKVDRALAGGAIALGAVVEIEDMPGFFPLTQDRNLQNLSLNIMEKLVGKDEIAFLNHTTGSTDMGDLSTIMPVIQPLTGGVEGILHASSYRIKDKAAAYLSGAKLISGILERLLINGAQDAKKVLSEFVPVFGSKKMYFEYINKLYEKKVYSSDCIKN